jgi:hypothetical protein
MTPRTAGGLQKTQPHAVRACCPTGAAGYGTYRQLPRDNVDYS